MKTLAIIAGSAALAVLAFFAVVGFACLYMTAPMVQAEHRQCDDITRYEDGSLVCKVIMRGEDDTFEAYVPTALIPMSEPADMSILAETYNPQETVDGKELR